MRAEDIPQSVVEAGMEARPDLTFFGVDAILTAALREYERLGYRLVPPHEVRVELMTEALAPLRMEAENDG